jgi:hypothetical protein
VPDAGAPRVHVDTVDVRAAEGLWHTRWLVGNDGGTAFELTRAVAPHGRYRADERAIEATLAPGEAASVELDVRADPAGGEVENAFLILIARSGAAEWRILARLRVRVDDGVPRPLVERIDVQEVGFGGEG